MCASKGQFEYSVQDMLFDLVSNFLGSIYLHRHTLERHGIPEQQERIRKTRLGSQILDVVNHGV